ncbi:MAG TPA: rhodanese-like domain-containing protein, partial [Pyrinomonadaceae bacterium]
ECFAPRAWAIRASHLEFARRWMEMGDIREPPVRVSPEEAWRLVAEGRAPVFLDTRNARHYAQSDVQIPGSLYIWRGELEARIGEVPRGRPVVTYCA